MNHHNSVSFMSLALVMFGLAACSDSTPLPGGASDMGPPVVSNAQVLVGGVPVQGVVASGTGETALFRVRVHSPGGLGTIERVVLQYSQPGPNHHGGPMMGGFSGTVYLHDDGTRGDNLPGDGIFHFLDPENQIGCHGLAAPPGAYQYTFQCEDVWGQRSNALTVMVERR